MVGNKNSGRRDSLPRGGGRPRTRLIVHIPHYVVVQLEEIARVEQAEMLDVVREAILSYISDWQARHDDIS